MSKQQTAIASLVDEEGISVFQKLDRLDEQQIVAELQGRTSEEYFYELPGNQFGLSWEGTKAFRDLYAQMGMRLSITDVVIEKVDGGILSKAYVKRMNTGERTVGIAFQSDLMQVKRIDPATGKQMFENNDATHGKPLYDQVPDPFKWQKASSKSKRNGLQEFMEIAQIELAGEIWHRKKKEGWKGKEAFPTKQEFENMRQAGSKDTSKEPPPPKADPPPVKLTAEEAITRFQWYTQDAKGKGNRIWNVDDEWGWCNITGFGNNEILDIAKPIVEKISEAQGAWIYNNEIYSLEGEKLERRKMGTKT